MQKKENLFKQFVSEKVKEAENNTSGINRNDMV
jgi:hypothetical protein